jgi:hypothetical protein
MVPIPFCCRLPGRRTAFHFFSFNAEFLKIMDNIFDRNFQGKNEKSAILMLALREGKFKNTSGGHGDRMYAPTPRKIPDSRQIFAGFVEATRQLSVVAPTFTKTRIPLG